MSTAIIAVIRNEFTVPIEDVATIAITDSSSVRVASSAIRPTMSTKCVTTRRGATNTSSVATCVGDLPTAEAASVAPECITTCCSTCVAGGVCGANQPVKSEYVLHGLTGIHHVHDIVCSLVCHCAAVRVARSTAIRVTSRATSIAVTTNSVAAGRITGSTTGVYKNTFSK